jgi:hypothetical protein
MTLTIRNDGTPGERSYREAIAHLDEALAILDRPGEGLGYSWGLRRGQAGYFMLVRARDHLRSLRNDFDRHERLAVARREDSE